MPRALRPARSASSCWLSPAASLPLRSAAPKSERSAAICARHDNPRILRGGCVWSDHEAPAQLTSLNWTGAGADRTGHVAWRAAGLPARAAVSAVGRRRTRAAGAPYPRRRAVPRRQCGPRRRAPVWDHQTSVFVSDKQTGLPVWLMGSPSPDVKPATSSHRHYTHVWSRPGAHGSQAMHGAGASYRRAGAVLQRGPTGPGGPLA